MISDVQRALLATDRWAWLAGVLDRWFAEPLDASDGSTPADLAAAAARVGGELPADLVEWFTLVGRRLRAGQDAPMTPDSLSGDDDGLVVWAENQNVWSLVLGPDGRCVVDDEEFTFPPSSLADAMHGMLLGETLVSVWAGATEGPLGRLAAGVRGGAAMDADETEIAAVAAAYPELSVPGNPFWGAAPRGDADTVLRGDEFSGSGLEWMTASPAAFDRLAGVVDLDPPGGPRDVVVAFEDLTDAERAGLTGPHGAPATEWLATAVGDLGHVGKAVASAAGIRYHVTTTRPDETVAVALAASPTGKVVVAVRPERITKYRVVHPAGRAEYVLPD